jgi:hypothetical protein
MERDFHMLGPPRPHFIRESTGIESNATEHQCVAVRWVSAFAGRREARAALTRARNTSRLKQRELGHAFAISPPVPREVLQVMAAF